MSILFLLPLVIIGYFLLVRPQQQQVRRQRDLVSSLRLGAEVQTAGGIVGRIIDLDDQFVQLQVGPGTVITFIRSAVQKVISLPDEDAADLGSPEPGDQPYGSESIDLTQADAGSAGATPGPVSDEPADQAAPPTQSLPANPTGDPAPPPTWSPGGASSEGGGEDAPA